MKQAVEFHMKMLELQDNLERKRKQGGYCTCYYKGKKLLVHVYK